MASNGDLPGMAPHIVGGTARYTAGVTRLRMTIHMSLASVVAHTMGLQLSGFAQLPSWHVRFPDGDIPQARGQVPLQVQREPAVPMLNPIAAVLKHHLGLPGGLLAQDAGSIEVSSGTVTFIHKAKVLAGWGIYASNGPL